MIGWNDHNQWNKQFNFNPKRCGPKGSNTQYSQEPPNLEKLRMQSTLISRVKKKISPKNRHECDRQITVAELEEVIKSFENKKSPVNDGLSTAFYKAFKEILKTDLRKLYIEIFKLRDAQKHAETAVISCLYKKGDREYNYDNKLYTKILANKIQSTLEDTIGPEQTAAIKGRTIIENLELNRDVMSYANANNIQAAMIALEQKKAFDRVDWNFLLKALQHFRYGAENKSSLSKHRNTGQGKGHLLQDFLEKRGLRQGCTLSMILYIILPEIFLENMRLINGIKGIIIDEKELKTSAFADDATI